MGNSFDILINEKVKDEYKNLKLYDIIHIITPII